LKGNAEGGLLLGYSINKDFFGYRVMGMLGVRGFIGFGFQGNGGFEYDSCTKHGRLDAIAQAQAYGGIEGGADLEILKAIKWGNQYGSGTKYKTITAVEAMIRGQITGSLVMTLSCDENNCKLDSYLAGDVSVTATAKLFHWEAEWTAYQDTFAKQQLSEITFTSPLALLK